MAPTLDELTIADTPAAWRECGFEVDGDVCTVGEVRFRLAGEEAGRGLVGWSLREVAATDLDGLATSRSDSPPPPEPAAHPNGVTALDHVVAISPDLDRTDRRPRGGRPRPAPGPRGADAGGRAAPGVLPPRRADPRGRPGAAEAIERAGGSTDRPAFFWGLALVAPDVDASVASLGGDRVGEARDAVQPGRRIATLRRSAGLAVPVALISPPPPRG